MTQSSKTTTKPDAKQMDRLKAERAARPPEPGENDPTLPGIPGRAIPNDPETVMPLKPWQQTVDLILDTLTTAAGCQQRTEREKSALAITSRNVAVKRAAFSKHAEEIALLAIALPMGVSIVVEILARRNKSKGAEVPNAERAPGNHRPVGIGQEHANQERDTAGATR
jgi:hypothetical protein